MLNNSPPVQFGHQHLATLWGNTTIFNISRHFHFLPSRGPLGSDGYDAAVLVPLIVAACALLWAVVPSKRRQRTNKDTRKPRKVVRGEMPPVFPNGWIPVLDSTDLEAGKIISISVLGHDLVAFRSEDGTARVYDAYCPHLGAHLGVMGRIVGDCIECPFHGWRFDCKDGSCTHVPYSAKAPSFVKVKAWITKELLGLVFVWFHADGEEPHWEIPELLGKTLEQEPTGRFEHLVHCHIQDIAENGADLGHFNQIHKASSFVDGAEFEQNLGHCWKGRLLQHHWDATWKPDKHEAMVSIESSISIFSWTPDFLRHHIEARQVGPALVAISVWGRVGHYVALQSLRPEGPFDIRVVHTLHFEPQVSRLLRWFYTMTLRNMVDRDVAVWNFKAFVKRPALVKKDQSIAAYRKWYSQFYSNSSATWQEIREQSLDW